MLTHFIDKEWTTTYNVIKYFVPLEELVGNEDKLVRVLEVTLDEDELAILEVVLLVDGRTLDEEVFSVVVIGTVEDLDDVEVAGGAVPGTHWTIDMVSLPQPHQLF
jgi:hypothetical protein